MFSYLKSTSISKDSITLVENIKKVKRETKTQRASTNEMKGTNFLIDFKAKR
jgi:hypothetical protein